MAWVSKILCWIAVVSFFLICASSRAETNAASPWRAAVPGLKPLPLVATNAVPAPPPAEKATADGDEFFSKFRDAVQLLNHNHAQDAGIVMDLLTRAMSTSPWLEIALLKHAQLIESTNDEVAEEGYQLLRHRIANAPYFQSNADRANIFGVALQGAVDAGIDRKSTRLNSSHERLSRMPSSA